MATSTWTCSTCCWGDRDRAGSWWRCPRPRSCESTATARRSSSWRHKHGALATLVHLVAVPMEWCGGASELIGVRQSGACARPAGSDWCAARRWFGLISYIRVHRLGECHGTPILWHTFGVPRTLHTERHVHGTPILYTWHTHIMAQLIHLWRLEGGARCGRVSVKARRCGLHVPRDGSGEPARA